MVDNNFLALAELLEKSAAALRKADGTLSEIGLSSESVRTLSLSVRTRKALLRLQISTVFELSQTTASQLMACKNFGSWCLEEVEDQLSQRGLSLRKEQNDGCKTERL